MTALEIMVGGRDRLAAQEILSRVHCKDSILVSQSRRAAVYRILVEEEQISSVIQQLRQCIKTFSLCAVSKNEDDLMPHKMDPDPPQTHAFRALNVPVRDGKPIMRRIFGFKSLDE